MRQKRWWQTFEARVTALLMLIFVPNIVVSLVYLRSLPPDELIKVFFYPFVVSFGFFILTLWVTKRSEEKLTSSLGFDYALERVVRPYFLRNITCLGTKYEVEGGPAYWNALATNASRRFMLVSKTNSSWFNKGDEQCRLLATSFINLVARGGTVAIISHSHPKTVDMTLKFFRDYVISELRTYNSKERIRLKEFAISNIQYRVFDESKYSAVVSDDTILFMPVFNTQGERASAPWLEIVRAVHKREYQSFMADIERLLKGDGSEAVQLKPILEDA